VDETPASWSLSLAKTGAARLLIITRQCSNEDHQTDHDAPCLVTAAGCTTRTISLAIAASTDTPPNPRQRGSPLSSIPRVHIYRSTPGALPVYQTINFLPQRRHRKSPANKAGPRVAAPACPDPRRFSVIAC
jgi:hypothetical protein